MSFLIASLSSKKISTRLITAFIFYFALFFAVVIISYFILPDGLLRSKNSILDFELSTTLRLHLIQLLGYNLISVVLIFLFNYLTYQPMRQGYISSGYFMIGILFLLNAVTLGTWSFTIESIAPNLLGRLLRQFDLLRRSGFWEMSGQLIIACASSELAYKRRHNPQFTKLLSKSEKFAILIGLGLMLCGAFIETMSILKG